LKRSFALKPSFTFFLLAECKKALRASFAWKLEEEAYRFLNLVYEIRGELNPLKFDKIQIKGV